MFIKYILQSWSIIIKTNENKLNIKPAIVLILASSDEFVLVLTLVEKKHKLTFSM